MIYNDIKRSLECGDGKEAILQLAERLDDIQDKLNKLNKKKDGSDS